eukprot:gnl/TRDRNA2_/TRDRNA2_192521_c0_seq1.p1 gnl/TRDRNA2_/TRDRNA2_192521_c0~~gnl/TRDRNA2_/TRDRNA2_192521_c0_seq1.p1  ORF type:complete len:267 (-),score=80.00 gnl/TRDRNA2_/TRDRNA2_192521_c0_seq1:86-886(-)
MRLQVALVLLLVDTARSQCEMGDCYDGVGRLIHDKGEIYEGDFKEGQKHGLGIYLVPDGSKYTGEYQYGKMKGLGFSTFPGGASYYGEVGDEEKRNGIGIYSSPDGRKYEGDFVQDKKEGLGVFSFPDGANYAGMFSEKMHGFGVFTFPDGRVDAGEFNKDRMHGCGQKTIANETGIFVDWEGEWEDDKNSAPCETPGCCDGEVRQAKEAAEKAREKAAYARELAEKAKNMTPALEWSPADELYVKEVAEDKKNEILHAQSQQVEL